MRRHNPSAGNARLIFQLFTWWHVQGANKLGVSLGAAAMQQNPFNFVDLSNKKD